MAVQYNAAINPLVIMFTIPLALIGVILSLYLTGTPLGGTVLLGVIILIGVVVNNAIIMVEYIEILRRDKKLSREEAVVVAPPIRLVPIMMTTITTVVGMLPLALGWGEGSEPLKPLAIAVIGGLSFSTLLTLFVVPCTYLIFNSWWEKIKKAIFSE
jgi:multidrug efflux pump subunit AcrB